MHVLSCNVHVVALIDASVVMLIVLAGTTLSLKDFNFFCNKLNMLLNMSYYVYTHTCTDVHTVGLSV